MALENFDEAREYLARHNIHRLFESCIEDLVVARPNNKDGITQCIVDRVDTSASAKKTPGAQSTKYIFCLGLDDLEIDKALESALRGTDKSAGIVKCPPSSHHAAHEMQRVVAVVKDTCLQYCFITGFPGTLAQAMGFEAVGGDIVQAVVFQSSTGYDEASNCPKDDASETYKKYLHEVHPIATYYAALNKLTVCHVDASSGDKCPAAIVSSLLA